MTVIYSLRLKAAAGALDDEMLATINELRSLDGAISLFFDMLAGRYYPPAPKGQPGTHELNLGLPSFGHLDPESMEKNYRAIEKLATDLAEATKTVRGLRERVGELRFVYPAVSKIAGPKLESKMTTPTPTLIEQELATVVEQEPEAAPETPKADAPPFVVTEEEIERHNRIVRAMAAGENWE